MMHIPVPLASPNFSGASEELKQVRHNLQNIPSKTHQKNFFLQKNATDTTILIYIFDYVQVIWVVFAQKYHFDTTLIPHCYHPWATDIIFLLCSLSVVNVGNVSDELHGSNIRMIISAVLFARKGENL